MLCFCRKTQNTGDYFSQINKIRTVESNDFNVCGLATSSRVTFDPIYLSITPPESPDLPRFGASESNSSKNITQGVALLARLKTVSSMFDKKIKGIFINMNRPIHCKFYV